MASVKAAIMPLKMRSSFFARSTNAKTFCRAGLGLTIRCNSRSHLDLRGTASVFSQSGSLSLTSITPD